MTADFSTVQQKNVILAVYLPAGGVFPNGFRNRYNIALEYIGAGLYGSAFLIIAG